MRRDNCRLTVGLWCQVAKGLPMKMRHGIRDFVSRPAMCWAENMKLWWAAAIKSKRRTCMRSGALEVRELGMNTTDSLSQ